MGLAAAAFDALGGIGALAPEGGTHEVLLHAGIESLGVPGVIAPEGPGDVHPLGTGHAVATAGAAHLDFLVDGGLYPLIERPPGSPSSPASTLRGNAAVFPPPSPGSSCPKVPPSPPAGPRASAAPTRRGYVGGKLLKSLLGFGWQGVYQPAAPEGLHDDNRNPLLRRVLEPPGGPPGCAHRYSYTGFDRNPSPDSPAAPGRRWCCRGRRSPHCG